MAGSTGDIIWLSDAWNPKAGNVGITPWWSGGAASASLRNIEATVWPAGTMKLLLAHWAVVWIAGARGVGSRLVSLDDLTGVVTELARCDDSYLSDARLNAPNPGGAYVTSQIQALLDGGRNVQLGWQSWGNGSVGAQFYAQKLQLTFA